MKKNIKLKLWSFFWIFVVVFLFVALSYFVQTRLDFFEGLIVAGWVGMVIHVLLNVLAVVFAPITVLPLISLAVGLWGVGMAVFLTVLGWTLGSFIAFGLSRKFGVPIIRRFISLDELYTLEDKMKVGNTFWSVLLLRLIVPVDILSYALGLFSHISFWSYALATVIGILPFAFGFAYLGGVPYIYQAVLGLGFLIIVLVVLIFREVWGKKK
ncbi:MAG TPA: TVP38/TMEM64 family protein [Candidatus Pacearchaeota archaeon]|nr:TVP38/TMEM64 family protein [Candidatus Pacearchaeota archaeon]